MTLNELLRDRGRSFWILNVTGWFGYVLTTRLGVLAYEQPDSYIAVIVATALIGFLLTIAMRLLYRRWCERSPVAIAACDHRRRRDHDDSDGGRIVAGDGDNIVLDSATDRHIA